MDSVNYAPGSITSGDHKKDFRIVIAKYISNGPITQVVLNGKSLGWFSDLSMSVFFEEVWNSECP